MNAATGAPKRVQHSCAQDLLFQLGAVLPVQRVAVVIEITFRLRLVQKTVEITKVVVRAG